MGENGWIKNIYTMYSISLCKYFLSYNCGIAPIRKKLKHVWNINLTDVYFRFCLWGNVLKMKSEMLDVSQCQLYFSIRDPDHPENHRLNQILIFPAKNKRHVASIKGVFFGENGVFCDWYTPKKLKYGKPRLCESTLT